MTELPNVKTKATTHSKFFFLVTFLYINIYVCVCTHLGNREMLSENLCYMLKAGPQFSHSQGNIWSVQDWGVKCASISEADDELYSATGNVPTGFKICISVVLIFFCIFNVCNLVEDRIQFCPLITVSYMAAGFTLNSLQIAIHGSEISNAVTFCQRTNSLAFLICFLIISIFGLFVNIMHMGLGLQYYVSSLLVSNTPMQSMIIV